MALNHDVEGFGERVRGKHYYLQLVIKGDSFVIA